MNPEPHTFSELGGKERPKDTRDYKLGAVGAVSPHPAIFMQDAAFNAPIYYQGKIGSCGAHAGTWLSTFLRGNKQFTPRFTWIDIKTFDGYALDEGTDMRSIFKSLQATGTNEFLPLANDVTLPIEVYSGAKFDTQILRENAAGYKISSYGFKDSLTFDELKGLIYENKAVILLIRVGKEMWTRPDGSVSWAEGDVLPMRPPAVIESGHFVVAHSYSEDKIWFANSWSTSWGHQGHGYFNQNYMPFVTEVGTATIQPAWVDENKQKKISIIQQLIALYQALLKVNKDKKP